MDGFLYDNGIRHERVKLLYSIATRFFSKFFKSQFFWIEISFIQTKKQKQPYLVVGEMLQTWSLHSVIKLNKWIMLFLT